MELFERIRRDREREGMSIRELACRHGVQRRTVRQALASPWPPPRKAPAGRPAPKLGPYRPLIDEWLRADREAPRKQRHTAKRVWERLRDEHGADVAETTVRQYVRRRRRELGDLVDEVFVPQVHEPGVEAEVDWGEAEVEIAGQRRRVYLFVMRACYSGASFVMAFERQTQQAFLEAHVEAFHFFGGVFQTIRYDNLRSAVANVLRGRRRAEQDRFVCLRSHYLFESAFTRPGREGAHEKGGVEGEVGRFRRAHLVPVPRVASLKELNDLLEDGCFQDLGRRIRGRQETVGEALRLDARALKPLPFEDFDACEQASPRVDSKALVTIRQTATRSRWRSSGSGWRPGRGAGNLDQPHRARGRPPPAPQRALPDRGLARPLPRAPRPQAGRAQGLASPAPGARARPLARLLRRALAGIEDRDGPSEAARQMVDVLLLCREHGPPRVELAVRGVLAAGALDGRAVALLARRQERAAAAPLAELPERLLALATRAQPSIACYDELRRGRR